MADVRISQLPVAPAPIDGTELVPVVQNGQTVQTTVAAITNSPSQTQTFLTQTQELTLPNSRYLSTDANLNLTDGGATSFYRVNLVGAAASLNTSGGGVIVKDSPTTVVARSLAVSGNGLAVSNADGTGGNPTFALSGIAAGIANLAGTGIVAVVGASAGLRTLQGTTNQITIANGNGSTDPSIALATNPVLPGTGAVTIPVGNNAQQPVGTNGQIRYNTDLGKYEGYSAGTWKQFTQSGGVDSFSGGTTGLTPAVPTTGPIVLGGTLNVANGGTGATSLSGYVIGNGTAAFTASATIPTTDLSGTISNAQLANNSLTVNGVTITLGGSGTIASAVPNALTFGTGLNAGTFNGSVPVTISLSNTGVTAASYGAASKTLTATVDAQGRLTALADTPIAITNTQVSGLGTMSTQSANSVAIMGGAIDGTSIGGTVPSVGTFTNVAMTAGTITTTPTTDYDIVNKAYADSIASGLNYHQPVNYGSTAALPAYTYNNGVGGVGATITANANGPLSLGGGSPSATQRVLVKNETAGNAAYNGVYVVTDAGSAGTPFVLTRATDYDTSGAGTNEIDQGDYILVLSGTLASTAWVQQTALPIIVGTTGLSFVQFNAPISYTAGTGLNESPTYTFNIANTGVTAASYGTSSSVPTLAINAQGQVTSASNTSIAIDASQVTSGTFPNSRLTNSSLTVNGTAISLGGSGTITAANPNALTIGTGLTGTSYTGAAPVTIALATSGVAAATYGSASQVPVFAVDAYGRVTSVTNTAIAIAAGAVSGLAPSATTDTTNAANISSGTLPTGRLSGSYTGITGVGTLTAGTWTASAIGIGYGGTGLTATPTNGQLLIGNGLGYTLSTLTAGTNVSISNSAGGITISATPAAGGTVTSVSGSGGTTGMTLTGGPITTSGTLTLGGTLVVANGGTGATTLTGYVKGNGTSAMTASSTIPNTDITGLGTMSTQNASSVAITGGAIDGTPIGATTASTVRGTTITATTQFSGPGTGLTGTASGLSIGGSASSATTATTATNLAGGTAGALAYNSAAGTTTFLTLGTANYVLTAGATAPQYVAQSTLSVGSATTATTATNIAGGLANQIHYQTGAGATSFITAPSVASTYLSWNGTAFTWASAGTGSVTSVAVSGGTTGLTTSGGPITTSGTITLAGTLAIANGGTNGSATPTNGGVSYGTGTAYAFTAAGTSGQVLTSAGAASPTWTSQGSLSVGTATNISGGAVGSVPYQSAASTTAFLAGNTTTTPNFYTSTGTGAAAQAPTLTSSTGSGSVVLATSPTLVTPNLGTPSTLVGTNITGTASGLSIGGNAANVTGVVAIANGGTGKTTATEGLAALHGFATTATAAGTTTLTVSSAYQQVFTGTSTQTIVMPVTSTLTQGWAVEIINNSTGNLTVNSSGGNLIVTVLPNTTANIICILNSGTTAASWDADFSGFASATGTGSVVLATSPTLVTPNLGTPSTLVGTNITGTASGLSIGGNAATATTATNATNTGTTANSTNATNYIVFKSATTGNLPELVNASITCNPSTGAITGGISGGTF